MCKRGGDVAAFLGRFIIIGWRRGEGESAEQTKCGAPPPRECVCAGAGPPRLVREQGRGRGAARVEWFSSSHSMHSMQQFPALPAEEERYRRVLSANRVRRARSPPLLGPLRGHGPRACEGGWLRRSATSGVRTGESVLSGTHTSGRRRVRRVTDGRRRGRSPVGQGIPVRRAQSVLPPKG